MVLSLDVPDIFRVVPAGTCWPLTGNVILTPCDINDGGICDVDPLEVTFVLLDKFATDGIIGNSGKGDSTVWPNAILI